MKRNALFITILLTVGLLVGGTILAQGGKQEKVVSGSENEEVDMSPAGNENTEKATIGGGCFWCIEAVYERIEGVVSVVSGYAGGDTENPTYREISSGKTGHAEVVQIEYLPDLISYEKILSLFWQAHDPTTLNRQGADVGSQYRSIILYHNDEQRKVAEKSKQEAQKDFNDSIVTEIKALDTFYPAEDYHQDYYDNNTTAGYCRVVIAPKLKKLGLD